ncbi:MAG: NADH-quinone oxidoreductase subunit, partial [Thermodesulfobacteriota bacterium]|nr:NADH-quinone oxidoreductase subunit [Thermodesulfobacteriota bacterium]
SPREVLVLTPILVFVVWIGVYPNTFLRPMEPALKNFVQVVEKKRAAVLDREKANKSQLQSGSILALVTNKQEKNESEKKNQ